VLAEIIVNVVKIGATEEQALNVCDDDQISVVPIPGVIHVQIDAEKG
jgi:hypothetical protein